MCVVERYTFVVPFQPPSRDPEYGGTTYQIIQSFLSKMTKRLVNI